MSTNNRATTELNDMPPRYSAEDLKEFEALLHHKMAVATEDAEFARASISREASNDTDDTYVGSKELTDGVASMEREELMMVLSRQEKFIADCRAALERIRLGTYGICRATGDLIPKERLRLVPHATMSMAGKNARPTAS